MPGRSWPRAQTLQRRGLRERIQLRRPPRRRLSAPRAKANAARARVRSAVEHVFARQKHRMALFVRTIGLARARVKIGLANLTFNFTHWRGSKLNLRADSRGDDSEVASDSARTEPDRSAGATVNLPTSDRRMRFFEPSGWPALHTQFGAGVARLRNFRAYFLECLELALAAYPDARVTVGERGLVLHPSRPAIARA